MPAALYRECSSSPWRIRCSMSPRRSSVWSPRLSSKGWPDSGPMNLCAGVDSSAPTRRGVVAQRCVVVRWGARSFSSLSARGSTSSARGLRNRGGEAEGRHALADVLQHVHAHVQVLGRLVVARQVEVVRHLELGE